MKKFMTLIAMALIASTTAFAQSAKELAQQQKELNEINMKLLNAKPSKDSKKQCKDFIKDGWKVNAGDKSLEKQITYCQLLGEELMVDDEGNPTKRFILQTGRSTAGTYNAAYAAARMQANVELAGAIETKIAAAMEQKLDNSQSSSIDAVTVDKFHQRAKAIIDQTLSGGIPALCVNRVLPNGSFEVQVRLAYDKKVLAKKLKAKLQKDLEKEGDALNGVVDSALAD